MKPIEFPETNVVLGEGQPEYRPLPAHRFSKDPQGRMVFCWKLTWRERLAVLVGGVVWQQVLTFRKPLQPQLLAVEKPDMREEVTDESKVPVTS